MNTLHLQVLGIANTEMKTSLKNALDKIEGVQAVGISLPTGRVEVEYNPPADETQIKSCICDTGFHLS